VQAQGCKTGLAGVMSCAPPPCPSLWQRRLTEVFQGHEHAKVPAPVLGVPRLCAMPMPMEVNSSISRHECKHKGARQGWLGHVMCAPPCPSLWKRRLTEVFQGHEHAKVPAPVLGVPRFCAMPMEVNSSVSRHEQAQGCKTGLVWAMSCAMGMEVNSSVSRH
jgi:hypothetical protein